MAKNEALKELIYILQDSIKNNKFKYDTVKDAIGMLAGKRLKYIYNDKLFPALPKNHNWGAANKNHPNSLAEALLWKMGGWGKYINFSNYYENDKSMTKGTDVVNFAFAKFLKNSNLPIYDQHALRALWAIDVEMTEDQKQMCNNILFAKNGKWEPTAKGKDTKNCYDFYVERIQELSKADPFLTKDYLDRLLMPLGKAIKRNTSCYADLKTMCDWDN